MSSLDEDGVPAIGSNVNYEEVDALSQKRIIAFFNEFVCQAVTFLNNFSSVCEEKLFKVETRLERMETILQILESKLSSVPGLSTSQQPASTVSAEATSTPTVVSTAPAAREEHSGAQDRTATAEDPHPPPDTDLVPLSSVEPYRRYFRMINVGVPAPAVRIKMQQEGVDPEILERGDEMVPRTDQAPPPAAPRRASVDTESWSSSSAHSDTSSTR